MNVLAAAVGSLGLPVAFGFGLANSNSYSGTIELSKKTLTFRDQNIQVPFYNNILGYALDVTGDSIVLTSGLFQTAWKCSVSELENKGDTATTVDPFKDTDGCKRLRPKDFGEFYKGSETGLGGVEFDYGASVFQFNDELKGTFAPWAFDSVEKYGFDWGVSVAQNTGGEVAVGCQGCTSKSDVGGDDGTLTVENRRKPMSGLVFRFDNNNKPADTKDVSFVDKRFYGKFVSKLQTSSNYDNNGFTKTSGVGFGASVIYFNDKLLGARSRSSRELGRKNGYEQKAGQPGTCNPVRYGVVVNGLAICILPASKHARVGDVIDVSKLKRDSGSSGYPHGTNGGTVYGVEGFGYNLRMNSATEKAFGENSSPKQTPAFSRVGQSMTQGYFYGDTDLPDMKSLVVGAPGYGLTGAFLAFRNGKGFKSIAESGLRYPSYEAHETVTPSSIEGNFGASLHAFDLGSKWNHLAVGAPTHIDPVRVGDKVVSYIKGGAVFLYQKNEKFERTKKLIPEEGTISDSARFGSSITSIDVNGDGVRDLIVGAPFNQNGCLKFAPTSYCGALYVFDGKDLQGGVVRKVGQKQRIVGKDIFSMLGHALAASSDRVYATAPGGFSDSNGFFADALLKGLRSNVRDWYVTPRIVSFSKLVTIDVKTEKVGVTVFDADDEVFDATSVAGETTIIETNHFSKVGDAFRINFSASKSGGGGEFRYYYTVPDVFYIGDLYKITTSDGELCYFEDKEYCNLKNDGAEQNVYIEIRRIDRLGAKVKNEAEKLVLDSEFKMTQVVKTEIYAPSVGSKTEGSSIVKIGSILPSEVSHEFVLNPLVPMEPKVRLGAVISTLITVKNLRETLDSTLSLRVEIKNLLADQFMDYSTGGVWVEGSATSTIGKEAGVEFPLTIIKKKLGPIEGSTEVTIPLNFTVLELASTALNNQLILTAFLDGNEVDGLKKPKKVQVEMDDSCYPVVTGESDHNTVTGVNPGGEFTLTTRFVDGPGRGFERILSTKLLENFKVVDPLDENCKRKPYNVEQFGCSDPLRNSRASNFYPPLDYQLDPTSDAGCQTKVLNVLECTDPQLKGSGTSFTNKIRLQDTVPKGNQVTLSTDYSGGACGNLSQGFAVVLNVPEDKETIPEPEELAAWIIIVAVVGALLLAAIVVFVMWKIGFFKRKKPPMDEDDGNGELDEEVGGGSVLRG